MSESEIRASDNDAGCDNVLANPTVQCGDRSECSRCLLGLLGAEHALVLSTCYLVLKENSSFLTPGPALWANLLHALPCNFCTRK
jgi:hypothetical protein